MATRGRAAPVARLHPPSSPRNTLLRIRGGEGGNREEMLAAFEGLRADISQSVRRRPATLAWTASTVRSHLAPPSKPLPPGGVREIDGAYSYVALGDLKEDEDAAGRYVVVRQVSRPVKDTGVCCVVEDVTGDVTVMMSVCNLASPLGRLQDASYAIASNEILLLLDPCLKSSLSGGAPILCVDNPSHLIPLRDLPPDDLPPSLRTRLATWLDAPCPLIDTTEDMAAALEREGDAERAREGGGSKALERAAAAYTRALEACPSPALLTARAEVLLESGEALLAARDARAAVGGGTSSSDARARLVLARALAALQCDEEALEHLGAASVSSDAAVEGDGRAEALKARLEVLGEKKAPSREDILDLLRANIKAKGRTRLAMASYTALDLVEVRSVPGKGRGMFAKQMIPAGTILHAGRAIASTLAGEAGAQGVGSGAGYGAKADSPSASMCKWQALQGAFARGRAARCLEWLCKANETDAALPTDMSLATEQRPEAVASSIETEGGEYECIAGVRTCGLDVGRVLSAAGCNSFSIWALPQPGGHWSCLDASACGTGTGLFSVPSLFNHACVPNCAVTIVANYMIVATSARIPPGAELSLTYATAVDAHFLAPPRPRSPEPIDELVPSAPPKPEIEGPPATALGEWGFECGCAVCAHHADARKEYKRAAAILTEDAPALKAEPTKLGALLDEMRGLYPALAMPRDPSGDGGGFDRAPAAKEGGEEGEREKPHLAALLNIAALSEREAGNPAKAAEYLQESLRVCPPNSLYARSMMVPLPLHLRSRVLSECLAAAGDAPAAAKSAEVAWECASLAGIFELGVYDAWTSKVVQEYDMDEEDAGVIAALRGE